MKLVFTMLCIGVSLLNAVNIANWQDLRLSGKTSANQGFLQTEIASPNLTTNKLIYHNGSAMTETDNTLIDAATNTYQNVFPVSTTRRYVGLRLSSGTNPTDMIPVYYEGTGLPALNQMNLVSADAQNETNYNYSDIVNDYVTFSDTKIYGAIQNRGGGFPLSQNFYTVYPSYFIVIGPPDTNPNDPDAIVWAMVYMSVSAGGITPGLYKITGTSTSDLTRIGNISTSIVSGSNLLTMSCNIADLMADADFAAWYNPANPVFGFLSLTNRTTIIPFATTQQDNSAGCIVYPRALYVDPNTNTIPALSNPSMFLSDTEAYFAVDYSDAQQNFPLSASVILGENQSFPLNRSSNDFTAPMTLRTDNILSSLHEYNDTFAAFYASDNNVSSGTAQLPFFYIRGLQSPESAHCAITGNNITISWAAVTNTLEGNPVSPSSYRIEMSSDYGFADYAVLDTCSATQYTIPLSELQGYKFYRIVAQK